MSMKALTTNFSYNIISIENDPGSGQKLALAFQNEGAELKVATYDSDADSQVWTLTGSKGNWALSPQDTSLSVSPRGAKHVQAKDGAAYTWNIVQAAEGRELYTIQTLDGEWYWKIERPAVNEAISLDRGTGHDNQKWLFKEV